MKNLKFICPECGSKILECVENGTFTSVIKNISDDGDFDYAPILANESDVQFFQCTYCNFIVMDDNGEKITNNEDLIKWIKENC